jgi:hypothetical protein
MRASSWIWVFALVLSAGTVSLLCEHLQLSRALVESAHVLFGVLAIAATSAALLAGGSKRQCSAELRAHMRRVSRWVYVLLYILAVVRVGLHLLDLRPIHIDLNNMDHAVNVLRPPDDFGIYLACCIIPLYAIRALILGMARSADRQPR